MARRPRSSVVIWAAALGFTTLACAHSARSPEAPGPRRVLLGDEITAAAVGTALEAVSRLRPEWLRRRGPISVRNPEAGEVVVYLNGMPHGGPTTLRSISAESVLQMQFLSGSEATIRFGTGHGGGVILVQTQ